MKKIFEFMLARLRERSTWLGLTGLFSAIGVGLAPDQIDAIAVLGVAVASAIAVFTADKSAP